MEVWWNKISCCFHLHFIPPHLYSYPSLISKKTQGWSISVKLSSRNNDGISESFYYITGNCYRCLSIHQKHGNVLQYKESRCMLDYHPRNYHELCWSISVDEPLKTMFRVNGNGVSCPITGTFSFSYSRGHGLCNYPLSSLHQCAGKCHSHFIFYLFQTDKKFLRSFNCTLYHISLHSKVSDINRSKLAAHPGLECYYECVWYESCFYLMFALLSEMSGRESTHFPGYIISHDQMSEGT